MALYEDLVEILTPYAAAIARRYTKAEIDELLESLSDGFDEEIGELRNIIGQIDTIDSELGSFCQELEVDENGLVYLLNNGSRIAGPYGPFAGSGGGGGGGGSTNAARLTVENYTGWLSNTIAYGDACTVSLTWSSIEDGMPTGNGTLSIKVNGGSPKAVLDVAQGTLTVSLTPYLAAGLNVVQVIISDVYGNSRTINFTIQCVQISISSTFDDSAPFRSSISFRSKPVGEVAKVIHYLVDGYEIGSTSTSVSDKEVSYTIPAQTHGAHSLECYFTCVINGQTVESNHLYYSLICLEAGNTAPVISSSFRETSVPQYTTLQIEYYVYDPANLTADIDIYVNGSVFTSLTVDRLKHTFSYRADETGSLTIRILSGNAGKFFTLNVTESDIHVAAETDQLKLHLSSYGRSNDEEHPERWSFTDEESNTISASLTDFNFASDGWVSDPDGITVLRVAGDARVEIPYNIFTGNIGSTGKTVEFEFATRDVRDYEEVIISCFKTSGNRDVGLKVTAQKAVITSPQTQLFMQYKEEEHVRLSFVIEKEADNRLIYVYVNGIMSGAVRYPSREDFSIQNPDGILIGSNECTVDLYDIRVYDNNLTSRQILDNWIADTQDLTLMLERYHRNDVLDEYGNVSLNKLPSYLPYMIIECAELPQSKGDKKTVSGSYVDPVNTGRSFTFTGCQANVQGTSSAVYPRKNYDLQFKNGFEMHNGNHAASYELDPSVIPFNRFVLKADYASSEGANNVELVKLYNDADPYIRPERQANPKVRDGIFGFPIVLFWHDTVNDVTEFMGKYNFNLPKRAPEPYGYSGDMESWEFENNTANLMLFKSDYFDESIYMDPETKEEKELWKFSYEARFPDDTWSDYSKLQEFESFVYSTYRGEATGEALAAPVSYGGVTYDHDTAAYRLAKFKAEFGYYAEVDSFLFYYLFTDLFLLVDSRAKNLFIGFSGSYTDPSKVSVIDRKAVAEPYDMDTAIGINNEGELVFGYELEDIDLLDGVDIVYNGQDSVLWCNIRDAFSTELGQMYQRLRSSGVLSYSTIEQRFEEHQSKWPEAVFNEDSYFKYLLPLFREEKNNLKMLQGAKAEQRKWWLFNRFRYIDSKYHAGDALSDVIELRAYARDSITVTPYADIYITIKYGSHIIRQRAYRNNSYTLECPLDPSEEMNDTEVYIYSPIQIASLGDLSGLVVGRAIFSKGKKLRQIKLGDADPEYRNGRLNEVEVGNNTLLNRIDVRNCFNLAAPVDLSGCANIEYAYFDGTAVTGVALPNGGILKVLHLPGTITNLTILNQPKITDFTMPSYSNISTLWLENVSSAVNAKAILRAMSAGSRVRLTGFYWECTDYMEVEELYDIFDTMRGLSAAGATEEHIQLSGTIHVYSMSESQYARLVVRYSQQVSLVIDRITEERYTITWCNSDGTVLYYSRQAKYGSTPQYNGSTPTNPDPNSTDTTFRRWKPDIVPVTGDATYTASFIPYYTVTFKNGNTTLQAVTGVDRGATAVYTGAEPTKTDYDFIGWNPQPTNITADTICSAQFIYSNFSETITDTWDEILANITNGSYLSRYSIGDTKKMQMSSKCILLMELVGMETDELENGGFAPTTWLAKYLYADTHIYNANYDANVAGSGALKWGDNPSLRNWLQSTVMPLIPYNIRSSIKSVKKYSSGRAMNNTSEYSNTLSYDELWIPSMRELGISGYETMGPIYVTDANSRKRALSNGSGTYQEYYTRSNQNGWSSLQRIVKSDGSSDYAYVNNWKYVVLGFCL